MSGARICGAIRSPWPTDSGYTPVGHRLPVAPQIRNPDTKPGIHCVPVPLKENSKNDNSTKVLREAIAFTQIGFSKTDLLNIVFFPNRNFQNRLPANSFCPKSVLPSEKSTKNQQKLNRREKNGIDEQCWPILADAGPLGNWPMFGRKNSSWPKLIVGQK